MSQDYVPIHLLNAQYSRITSLILLGNSFYDMVITFPKEIQNIQQPVGWFGFYMKRDTY